MASTAFFRSIEYQNKASFSTHLTLNRILFHANEIEDNEVKILDDDYRKKHIQNILKANVHDTLKIGIINEGIGEGTIIISDKDVLSIKINKSEIIPTESPSIDLMMAVPRPLRLERLLPITAMMGISKLLLIDAEKVEKDYFGSHLFRRPEAILDGFIEGLSQADVDVNIPELLVRRKLKKFMFQELDTLFPLDQYTRLIAHPVKENDLNNIQLGKIFNIPLTTEKVVIAVGPEGGWTDEELELFQQKGFRLISLGNRVLRTDVAVQALLGILNEYVATSKNNNN